ncbi:MAG: S-layer homology domain-containing protein [Chloroflexia bacterium]
MSRRIFGLGLLISTFGLLIAAALFSSMAPAPAHGAAVQPGAAQAITTQIAQNNRTPGQWADIAPFPMVTLSPTPLPPTPSMQPLKVKRAAAAAYFPNGKLYNMGGRFGLDGQDTPLSSIYEYTPGSPGTWLRKNAQIDPGSQGSIYSSNMASAVLTDSGGVHIYAIGGNSINSEPTPVVRVYDPVADTISNLTSDPWPANPVREPGGWAVYNNKLYIFGGFSSLVNGFQGGVFTDTWRFDPMAAAGSKWTQLTSANLNLGRAYIAGATLDGFIYAIGGDTWNPATQQLIPQTNVERLDPSQPNPVWVNVASLPTARGDLGAWAYDTGSGFGIAGKVAVAGGHYDVPDNLGYIYTPSTNSWASFPNMVHATRNYGYAQLNGFLYAFGGYDYSANTPDAANFNQAYDASGPPPTPTVTVTGTPPSPTRTGTITPTSTQSSTPTATATPCTSGAIQNGGFETGSFSPGWVISGTNNIPIVDNSLPHSGTYAALLGTLSGTEPTGNSSISQTLTVPAGGGTLSYWWNGSTSDSITFDWQDAYILNAAGTVNLAQIMHVCTTTGTYQNVTFNMTPFAGQTVRLVFEVHQDGFGDVTSMYVDDVMLNTPCTGGTTTATATAPANTPTRTATATAPANTPTVTRTNTPTSIVPTTTPSTVPTSTIPANTPTNAPSTVPTSTTPANTPTNTPTSVALTVTPTTTPVCGGPTTVPVIVDDDFYSPQFLTIVPGTTVIWTNSGDMIHTVTSDDGLFDSGNMNPTDTFTYTFSVAGTYGYHCIYHGAPGIGHYGTIFVVPPPPSCPTVTATPPSASATPAPSSTQPPATVTPVPSSTQPASTATPVPSSTQPPATATATACTINFSDVHMSDYFYVPVQYLYCHGVISGYSDGTFRPYNYTTRAQMVKIVVLGFNKAIVTPTGGGYTFTDVTPSNNFYAVIETAAADGIVSGYNCGTAPAGPCDAQHRPWFLPYANVTRGQLSKIDVNAAGWMLYNPPVPHFIDVLPGSTFYTVIETAFCHGVVSGYSDRTFRPFNNATRGQVAKIVYLSIVNPPTNCGG